jgi:hypothetical protein
MTFLKLKLNYDTKKYMNLITTDNDAGAKTVMLVNAKFFIG